MVKTKFYIKPREGMGSIIQLSLVDYLRKLLQLSTKVISKLNKKVLNKLFRYQLLAIHLLNRISKTKKTSLKDLNF